MKAQISLEFTFVFFVILLTSLITIANFLSKNFTIEDWEIDKIDNAAKTAVMLINSRYEGVCTNTTLIYSGIKWNKGNKVISIYISPRDAVDDRIRDFILSYIENNTNIEGYNITVNP
ncbi:hypothetical protein J422_05963 [Methanocaldococcus villosus KIN24-T80]|uniref:Class III signal peptide-containing protein n=1 Tax=Methanocaldococcus villosus KIN24-T80 TaxID=1069083 RepID=N6VRJ7_9EURY|nr:class III signal peptide-containing protein [Methanocaldococcus villosus]ENN95781.1 hypothetical protein J422_05963 [Methanocaldococcus villosus KIN24-T80]